MNRLLVKVKRLLQRTLQSSKIFLSALGERSKQVPSHEVLGVLMQIPLDEQPLPVQEELNGRIELWRMTGIPVQVERVLQGIPAGCIGIETLSLTEGKLESRALMMRQQGQSDTIELIVLTKSDLILPERH